MTGTPVRAVVFDAVGTLLHPDPAAVAIYVEVGRRFGSQLDQNSVRRAFRAAVARQDELDCARGWRTSETREVERWRSIVGEVLHDATDAEACFAALYDHFGQPSHWQCESGAGEVLAALGQRGCKAGLASNFDCRLRRVAAGFSALAGLGHLVISSEVGWRKPAAEFFAAVCLAVNAAPQQVLYVGDDPLNDYHGALAAGCGAVISTPQAAWRGSTA